MSSSEIESGKTASKSRSGINGWWRIWIVVSTIWFLIVISYSTINWFEEKLDKEVANHYKIIESLDVESRKLIVADYENNTGIDVQRVEFPNGQIVDFKSPIDENKLNDLGALYWESGKSIQKKNRIKFISFAFVAILLPPILFSFIGVSIAWIIKGFRQNGSENKPMTYSNTTQSKSIPINTIDENQISFPLDFKSENNKSDSKPDLFETENKENKPEVGNYRYFNNILGFKGSINRIEYFISAIIYLTYLIFSKLIASPLVFKVLLFILFNQFYLAQSVKRCHDIGRSGWYCFIPGYFIILCFKKTKF